MGDNLLRAIIEYENEEYDKSVELILPIRNEIWKLGGSNAQRDVFHLVLLSSASKSKSYQDLARYLNFNGKKNYFKKLSLLQVLNH